MGDYDDADEIGNKEITEERHGKGLHLLVWGFLSKRIRLENFSLIWRLHHCL